MIIIIVICLILLIYLSNNNYELYQTIMPLINQYDDKPIEDIYYNRKLINFYNKYGYYPFYTLLPYVYPEYNRYYKLWNSQNRKDIYLSDEY